VRAKKTANRSILVTLTLCIIIIVSVFFTSRIQIQSEAIHSEPPLSYSTDFIYPNHAEISGSMISPDGNNVVVLEVSESVYSLQVTELASQSKSTLVESQHQLFNPRWIKENQIVFGRCYVSICEVVSFDIRNKLEQVLYKLEGTITAFDYHPDSFQLALEKHVDKKRVLSLISLRGSSEIEERVISESLVQTKPVFSLDGSKLFFRNYDNGYALNIYNVSKNNTKDSFLVLNRLFSYANKDEHSIWVTGRKEGVGFLWQLDLSTGNLVERYRANNGEALIEVSAPVRGKNLILRSLKRNIDIGQAGIEELDFSKVSSDMIEMNAVYSPLAKVLYFASNRTGFYELWRYKGGEGLKKLTNTNSNVIERPVLSHDNQLIAFSSRNKQSTHLNILDIQKQSIVKKVVIPSGINILSWSLDAKFLYFSRSEKGQYNLYRFNLLDGDFEKIAASSGLLAYERDSDSSLFFANLKHKHLMKQNLNGEISIVAKSDNLPANLLPHQVKIIGNDFYYLDTISNRRMLMKISLDDALKTEVMQIPEEGYVTQIGENGEQVFVLYDQLIKDASKLFMLKESG